MNLIPWYPKTKIPGFLLVLLCFSSCADKDNPKNTQSETYNPSASEVVEAQFLEGKLNLGSIEQLNQVSGGAYEDLARVLSSERFIPDTDTAEIEKVSRKFGASQVDISQLPHSSSILDSGTRPWSSWWF